MNARLGNISRRKLLTQLLNDHRRPLPVEALPRGDQVQWRSKVIAERHGKFLPPPFYRLLAAMPASREGYFKELRLCTCFEHESLTRSRGGRRRNKRITRKARVGHQVAEIGAAGGADRGRGRQGLAGGDDPDPPRSPSGGIPRPALRVSRGPRARPGRAGPTPGRKHRPGCRGRPGSGRATIRRTASDSRRAPGPRSGRWESRNEPARNRRLMPCERASPGSLGRDCRNAWNCSLAC